MSLKVLEMLMVMQIMFFSKIMKMLFYIYKVVGQKLLRFCVVVRIASLMTVVTTGTPT